MWLLLLAQLCAGNTTGCIREVCANGSMMLVWDPIPESRWFIRTFAPQDWERRYYEIGLGDPITVIDQLYESSGTDDEGVFWYSAPPTRWHVLQNPAFVPQDGMLYKFHVRACDASGCSPEWAPRVYDDILGQCMDDYVEYIGQPWACFRQDEANPLGCETDCALGSPIRFPLIRQCR